MAFYSDWGVQEWAGVGFILFVLASLGIYIWNALRKKPPEAPT